MDRAYIKENARSRERLAKLAKNLTDDELRLVIYKEGWTIAAALAHLAFWDERRRIVLEQWQQEGVTATPHILDIVNDALIPILLAIPPRKAAELAVATAGALDREIEALPDKLVKEIEALNEPHTLDRATHRNSHLDEIEAFLKAIRKAG
jgi:hypothetical protein